MEPGFTGTHRSSDRVNRVPAQAGRIGAHGLLLVDGRAMDGGPLPDCLDEPAAAATRLFVEGRLGAGASR